MKKSLQIPNEINDVITAMVAPFSITSISENSGVSTIITTTVTIFDNLSTTMLLQDGMIVTLDSINYVVSNVINSLVQSFDITATGLTATEWSIAANFKPGTRKEINQILDQDSGSLDRFPLIWLILPNSKDYDNEVIDFTTDLVLVFAHKSNDTDRSQKRYDENISPVIQPLLDLFLLWVASSDFNYMFEFEGYGKTIDYNDSPFAFYGNDDKTKSVLEVNTDAIEVSMELNFKKQFEDISIPITSNIIEVIFLTESDFTAKLNISFTGSLFITWENDTVSIDSGVDVEYNYGIGLHKAYISGDTDAITKFIAESTKMLELNNFNSGIIIDFRISNNLLSGALDLSRTQFLGFCFAENMQNLTGIIFNNDSLSKFSLFRVRNNNINNINFTIGESSGGSALFTDNNMSSEQVDNQIINIDNSGWADATLSIISGNGLRTSASDTAYNSLISKGWVIS